MNETINDILNRRSIRKFKQDQIKDEELNTIIEAAKFAPSAMNQQPWHFTVVQNKEVIQKVVETCRTAFLNSGNPAFEGRAKAENFNPFYNAPTLIIVTADEKAVAPQNDGSLAIANILLSSQALNIGTCWIHALGFVFGTEEGKKLKAELGIPEGFAPVGTVAVGYKDMEATAPARKEGTVTIIK